MAMEEAVIARLKQDAGVAALISGPNRISWFERIEGAALPALTLLAVSTDDGWSHDGPTGLDRARLRIDCWADTRTAAKALARAVRPVMEAGGDQDGIRLHPARRVSERDFDEGEQDGGDALFRVSQEYQLYHEEI